MAIFMTFDTTCAMNVEFWTNTNTSLPSTSTLNDRACPCMLSLNHESGLEFGVGAGVPQRVLFPMVTRKFVGAGDLEGS